MEIDERNFGQLPELVQSGTFLIGVHTAGAASFFDKKKSEMEETIGESASFERNVVVYSEYLSSITFVCSIFFAIKAFGWWAIIAVAIGFGLQAFRYAFSQLGIQRIIPTIISLTFTAIIVVVLNLEFWPTLWILSILLALFFNKLKFYTAHHFLRSLVVRNYRAFAMLNGTIVSVKDVNVV